MRNPKGARQYISSERPWRWGLVPYVLTILGLVWRLFDEERFLSANLPGYSDYCAKVRWHLIPGIF